jgi:hypothetical protein
MAIEELGEHKKLVQKHGAQSKDGERERERRKRSTECV